MNICEMSLLKHTCAIFDMDGTIIDSMPAWKEMWKEYLISQDITPPDDIANRIVNKTLSDSSQYFIDTYNINSTKEEIVNQFHELMAERYYNGFPPKAGVTKFIEFLNLENVPCAVVTATAYDLARACLEKNGLIKLFDQVISCEMVGKSKEYPDAYNLAANFFNSKPYETVIFEDAPYAVKTAKNAGYYTVGVFDEYYASQRNEMREMCDLCISDFRTVTIEMIRELF